MTKAKKSLQPSEATGALLTAAEAPLIPGTMSESAPIYAELVRAETRKAPDFDMHYGLELGIVLTGRMGRYWQNWHTELETGQVWYCGVWEPHGWEILEAPCEHLVLVLLPDVLADTGLSSNSHDWLMPFRLSPDRRPQATANRQEVLGLARHLVGKLSAREPEKLLWYRLLTLELLLELERGWPLPGPRAAAASLRSTSLAGAVEKVFGSHHVVTVPEAAAAAGMSTSAFNRSFKRLTGIPFAKFARRHRVGQAALQLLKTDDPVKKVASDWGFADRSHFHRCFLQHYRCSPGKYRERRRQEPMLFVSRRGIGAEGRAPRPRV